MALSVEENESITHVGHAVRDICAAIGIPSASAPSSKAGRFAVACWGEDLVVFRDIRAGSGSSRCAARTAAPL